MLDFLIPNAMAADEAVTATQAMGAAGFEGLLFPVALIIIFYFLLIRPQQKRNKEHKELVAGSKKGDEIVTNGGLLGKITDVDDSFITLEIGPNMSVQVMKSSISSVMPKGTYAAAGKAKK
ncbi:MAG: preprotein translocase subunit YajC [Cycloclasticus sp.]|jgi:preprotein translocase subunit YajC|nr:MAG: preprotein translocase subunit YajC [Cycloclasticus sp. Phe_18]MDF1688089.1 preprotein translocase subunit YajC [Cycloclasticus sp.]MEE4290834.1 preprotein translocase subunit YajC [Cycloclasticus sp.]